MPDETPLLVLKEPLWKHSNVTLTRTEWRDGHVSWVVPPTMSERDEQIAETAFQMGVRYREGDGVY